MIIRRTGEDTYDIVAETGWEIAMLTLIEQSLTIRRFDSYRLNETTLSIRESDDNKLQDLIDDFTEELRREVKDWRFYSVNFQNWRGEDALCL